MNSRFLQLTAIPGPGQHALGSHLFGTIGTLRVNFHD
jgi:hypothetical protein